MPSNLNRKTLYEAIQVLKDNVVPSDLAEVSKYAIFHNNRICAMNDAVAVSVPLVLEEPVECAVDLQLLYDFVRKMNDKEVLLGMNNGNLKIRGKNLVAEFAVADMQFADQFIQLDTSKFRDLPETFANALTFTGFVTDKEEAAYSQCAIKDGVMYALSAYRCAKFDMGDGARNCFDGVTFISPDCLGFVNKMLPKKYYSEDGWIHLYDNDLRIYSFRTRMDDRFPFDMADNFTAIPNTPAFRFPPDFNDVLDRLNPFSGRDAKVKKVTIHIEKGTLQVVAQREDGSRCKETVQGVMCDEVIHFTANLKLLSDMFNMVEKFYLDTDRLCAEAPFYQCMIPLTDED